MCAAYQLEMTQREGYAWFLPGWFDNNWYDIDELRRINNETDKMDNNQEIEKEENPGGNIDGTRSGASAEV